MLEVRELECVRGDHRLFKGLNFTLQPGELLHLRGKNGAGKTSLLRTICGLTAPASGEVLWKGENIRSLRDEYNRGLTFLGHLNGIKGELSALENLRISSSLSGEKIPENQILDALHKMGLKGREDLPTKVLSQGQKRRVALARLLITKTTLWVLDEPFTALDVHAIDVLKALIARHIQAKGLTILTTHQHVEIDVGVLKEIDLSAA
ncbi:MAG: cytochrome c biogenesis heme-transporting ATPase CcmA [Gammaproteobacteria bacterium]|nr:cytochrome c biogenesis heme-transporting ATPase CcmA [Gammaproteobacteria bacterium]